MVEERGDAQRGLKCANENGGTKERERIQEAANTHTSVSIQFHSFEYAWRTQSTAE